jgi:hypothetical protein
MNSWNFTSTLYALVTCVGSVLPFVRVVVVYISNCAVQYTV